MPDPKQSQAIAALKAAAERNLRRVWRALPPEQRKQIRKVAHPANLAKIQRTATAKPVAPLQRPQLAVIVLLTDDAGDPALTLRSLVGQQPAALELMVVDTSLAGLGRGQVREFAKRDSRVKYLALPGSREEAARGLAVAQSRAPYLMFLTAGDVIEKASLDPMLRSLRTSGSSFAVGMTGIVKGKTSSTPVWQRDIHAEPRPAVAVSDVPGLLRDGALGNKVFRRDFWTSATAGIETGQ